MAEIIDFAEAKKKSMNTSSDPSKEHSAEIIPFKKKEIRFKKEQVIAFLYKPNNSIIVGYLIDTSDKSHNDPFNQRVEGGGYYVVQYPCNMLGGSVSGVFSFQVAMEVAISSNNFLVYSERDCGPIFPITEENIIKYAKFVGLIEESVED